MQTTEACRKSEVCTWRSQGMWDMVTAERLWAPKTLSTCKHGSHLKGRIMVKLDRLAGDLVNLSERVELGRQMQDGVCVLGLQLLEVKWKLENCKTLAAMINKSFKTDQTR